MSIPLLVYLGVGLILLPRDININFYREISTNRVTPKTPVLMKLRVHNLCSVELMINICEKIPLKIQIIGGCTNQQISLPANEEFEMQYTFQAPRGHYSWEEIEIFVSDPLRLFEKKLNLSAVNHIYVLPEYAKIKRIILHPRSTIHTPGPNLSNQPGSGIDFWGIREYLPGDSLRLIDWQKSARIAQNFFVKEYEREEMTDIGLILDGRSITDYSICEHKILEYSIQATAALSKHFTKCGNRLSMLILSQHMIKVFPGYGKRQLVRILDQLSFCQSGTKVTVDTLKYLPTRLFPSHSVIILVSPLHAKDLSSLKRLKADGYQIVVLSPDYIKFTEKYSSPGKTQILAMRVAKIERALLFWKIRQLGVEIKNWDIDTPIDINLNLRRTDHSRGA
jgi:uncharacterized protein (DUF58 family)